MSDTTDLMGVRTDAAPASDASAAPASGAATGSAPRRRRSGTGLEGMVLAELQQVAQALGIKGTARMRKGQLIEVIKERQVGGNGESGKSAAAETAEKPKRRATSRARTGDTAEQAAAPAGQAQIEIPGQPGGEKTAERRSRRTAPAEEPQPQPVAAGAAAPQASAASAGATALAVSPAK